MTGTLKHLVFFQFKDQLPPAQLQAGIDQFLALPRAINSVDSIEWGTNVSTEQLSMGFTHCFSLSFPDAPARDSYLAHPAHVAFTELIGPMVEKVFVFDYLIHK